MRAPCLAGHKPCSRPRPPAACSPLQDPGRRPGACPAHVLLLLSGYLSGRMTEPNLWCRSPMPSQPAVRALRGQVDRQNSGGAPSPRAAPAAEVAQATQQDNPSTDASRDSLPDDSEQAEYYELPAPPDPPETTVCDRAGSDVGDGAASAPGRHSSGHEACEERGRQEEGCASSPGTAAPGPERPRSAKRRDEGNSGTGRPGREPPSAARSCRAGGEAPLIATRERHAREAVPLAERPIQAAQAPPGMGAKAVARPEEHWIGRKAASAVGPQPAMEQDLRAEREAAPLPQQQQQQHDAGVHSPCGRQGLAGSHGGEVGATGAGSAARPDVRPATRASPRAIAMPGQVGCFQSTQVISMEHLATLSSPMSPLQAIGVCQLYLSTGPLH